MPAGTFCFVDLLSLAAFQLIFYHRETKKSLKQLSGKCQIKLFFRLVSSVRHFLSF